MGVEVPASYAVCQACSAAMPGPVLVSVCLIPDMSSECPAAW